MESQNYFDGSPNRDDQLNFALTTITTLLCKVEDTSDALEVPVKSRGREDLRVRHRFFEDRMLRRVRHEIVPLPEQEVSHLFSPSLGGVDIKVALGVERPVEKLEGCRTGDEGTRTGLHVSEGHRIVKVSSEKSVYVKLSFTVCVHDCAE